MSLTAANGSSKSASYNRKSTAGTCTRAATDSGVSRPKSVCTACSLTGRPALSNCPNAAATRSSPSWAACCSSRTYARSAPPGCCATNAS
jgi:hypothetical protein